MPEQESSGPFDLVSVRDEVVVEETISVDKYKEKFVYSHMRDPWILRGVALVLGVIAVAPVLGHMFLDKDMGSFTTISSVAVGAFAAMITGEKLGNNNNDSDN